VSQHHSITKRQSRLFVCRTFDKEAGCSPCSSFREKARAPRLLETLTAHTWLAINMVALVTMGTEIQPGCLADRLLTGLGQPPINRSRLIG